MSARGATHCKMCAVKLTSYNRVYEKFSTRPYCKECFQIHEKERKTPEQVQRSNLRNFHGMTLEKYNEMYELHQGGCAICRQPCKTGRRLCVDHNHANGEIRGLLCVRCNAVLGQLNDDEDLIWNVLEYLKRTTWNKKEVA